MKIQAQRGTKDILPDEAFYFQYVDDVFKELCHAFGFSEIRVPTFEATELFQRGVGDASDIVSKEMYTFTDRGGRSITLRPEGTAGVVRAFIEHGMMSLPSPVKLFYNMNCFRYENVQKGRYREFWQMGCETFGSESADADAELILLLDRFYKRLGLNEVALEINSIGCPKCRPQYLEALRDYFAPKLDRMCGDCNQRFERNVLRIIDCKVESCQEIVKDAPLQIDYLCAECKSHQDQLIHRLTKLDVKFRLNGRIVRGLDYYTRTVFEFISEHVGTQGTIAGGGRYDGLVETLGGSPLPGVGFAMGIERLLMELKATGADLPEKRPRDLYVLCFPETKDAAAKLVYELRERGVHADYDLSGRSFRAQMKYAGKGDYEALIVLGEDEVKSGDVMLKWLLSGEEEQSTLDVKRLTETLENKRRQNKE